MLCLFSFGILGYVIFVFLHADRLCKRLILTMEESVQVQQGIFEKILEKKDRILKEKKSLEEEASRIYALYEMTREITKSLKEEEAFEIFKHTLKQYALYEECLYLDPLSEDIKELRADDRNFIFSVQGKTKKIGSLVVKGLAPEAREIASILGHQFALALRRVTLYAEIERIAITDSLTSVYTRRYALDRFEEELKRSVLRGIKMSYLMIDVDHFKNFNDTYGHLTGDRILKEVGTIIRNNIREIDIAGRFGGEEFCVVLPDTDKDGAHFAAERIRQATEKTAIKAYDATVKTTVSIGVATYPVDGKTTNELTDKADWALYRAKKMGRNKVCHFGVYKD